MTSSPSSPNTLLMHPSTSNLNTVVYFNFLFSLVAYSCQSCNNRIEQPIIVLHQHQWNHFDDIMNTYSSTDAVDFDTSLVDLQVSFDNTFGKSLFGATATSCGSYYARRLWGVALPTRRTSRQIGVSMQSRRAGRKNPHRCDYLFIQIISQI